MRTFVHTCIPKPRRIYFQPIRLYVTVYTYTALVAALKPINPISTPGYLLRNVTGTLPGDRDVVAAAVFLVQGLDIVFLTRRQRARVDSCEEYLVHSREPVQSVTCAIRDACAGEPSVLSHNWQLSSPAIQKV